MLTGSGCVPTRRVSCLSCAQLGWERFLPAELFFLPEQHNGESLHRLILSSIDATVALEASGEIDQSLAEGVKSDENAATAAASAAASSFGSEGAPGMRRQPSRPVGSLREALLGRIVLSGGSSQIKGLPRRLAHEIAQIVGGPSMGSVRVRPSIDGDATTWIGASVLAGTSTFADHWCVHAPSSGPPLRELVDEDDEEDEDYEMEDDDEEESNEEESEDESEEQGEGEGGAE